jgi:hypothetical protein
VEDGVNSKWKGKGEVIGCTKDDTTQRKPLRGDIAGNWRRSEEVEDCWVNNGKADRSAVR